MNLVHKYEGGEVQATRIDHGLYMELRAVYGSLTDRLLEMLTYPPKRLYLRVNTLRARREEVIESLRRRGVEVRSDDLLEEAIYIELEGPYQVRDHGRRVVVDDIAAESLMMGANLYRPGVVAYDVFKKGDVLTAVTKNGVVVAELEASVSSDQLKSMRRGLVAVNVRPVYRAPPIAELPEFKEGLVYPQSFPSMVAGRLVSPGSELVVDMNASPGGKTGHIVQLSRGRALVVAVDRSVGKVEKLVENLARLHLTTNVLPVPFDSRFLDLVTLLENRVGKVLIDPPCTNLGVRPKLSFKKTLRDAVNLADYQRQFMKVARRILRPGGVLVYSTCTLTRVENEENILYATRSLGLEPLDLGWVPRADKVYLDEATAYRFHPLKDDMPGFFIAVLRKP
ncbi:RsmB/NOP family class I SAM-dependent RNA methyltransferase [Thermogladius sp. KZ2Tp1]|uniref:PUA domain-containing protein n=1 Tax=Thermogladius sp. KZ2Tp1 TaxID=3136289 RepID=UPI003DA7C3EB